MRTAFWCEFAWHWRNTLALAGTENLGKEEKTNRWFFFSFIDEEQMNECVHEGECIEEKVDISNYKKKKKTLYCIISLFVWD